MEVFPLTQALVSKSKGTLIVKVRVSTSKGKMKHRLISTALGVATILLVQTMIVVPQAIAEHEREYPHEIRVFAKGDSIDFKRFGVPPIWTDCPTTRKERIELVERAESNVLRMLQDCGKDVHVPRLVLSICAEHPNRDGELHRYVNIWRPSVSYVAIQRNPDVLGRSSSRGSISKSFERNGNRCLTLANNLTFAKERSLNVSIDAWTAIFSADSIFGKPLPFMVHNQSEQFHCDVEVFPMLFEEGHFFMVAEANSPEGPWARSALEAVEYVILHELGHYESYITRNCKTVALPQVVDSEDAANYFASSVLRCW